MNLEKPVNLEQNKLKQKRKKKEVINRDEIAKGLQHLEPGLSQSASIRIVQLVFDLIIVNIKAGKDVHIPKFGRFSANYQKPREGVHPLRLHKIMIEGRVRVRFAPGASFKRSLQQHKDFFRENAFEEEADDKD